MNEDQELIERLARAPARYSFQVDVGIPPKPSAIDRLAAVENVDGEAAQRCRDYDDHLELSRRLIRKWRERERGRRRSPMTDHGDEFREIG